MREEEFDDFDEEEFEMLINGLIHPGDMFMSPDMLGGAYPPPVGGFGGMPGGGAPGGFGAPSGSFDDMIAQAYDDFEDD